jgi:hypothetical protein
MKTYKVYEIRNTEGIVEYVGETSNSLKSRLYDHTVPKPGYGNGKFYQRQDVSIHEVARFNNLKEARELEGQLKLKYGMEWTEKSRSVKGMTKLGSLCGAVNGKKCRKLTLQQANEIRSLYLTGNYLMKDIALLYNISPSTTKEIIRNRRYID